MPDLSGPREGEFCDLLISLTEIQDLATRPNPQAEKVAVIVRNLIVIGELEDCKLLIVGQRAEPLRVARSGLVMMLDVEKVAVSAPPSRSWIFRPQVLHADLPRPPA
ncbi:MAG: hypothetical protein HY000_32260 [Planctomycetes bacterium]|nr:hypothetical protein [Planctomycetota bacterium]